MYETGRTRDSSRKSGRGRARNSAHTHREGGEGHAHATEAIESQGDEDKDGEICKQHRRYLGGVPTESDMPGVMWSPHRLVGRLRTR